MNKFIFALLTITLSTAIGYAQEEQLDIDLSDLDLSGMNISIFNENDEYDYESKEELQTILNRSVDVQGIVIDEDSQVSSLLISYKINHDQVIIDRVIESDKDQSEQFIEQHNLKQLGSCDGPKELETLISKFAKCDLNPGIKLTAYHQGDQTSIRLFTN